MNISQIMSTINLNDKILLQKMLKNIWKNLRLNLSNLKKNGEISIKIGRYIQTSIEIYLSESINSNKSEKKQISSFTYNKTYYAINKSREESKESHEKGVR